MKKEEMLKLKPGDRVYLATNPSPSSGSYGYTPNIGVSGTILVIAPYDCDLDLKIEWDEAPTEGKKQWWCSHRYVDKEDDRIYDSEIDFNILLRAEGE